MRTALHPWRADPLQSRIAVATVTAVLAGASLAVGAGFALAATRFGASPRPEAPNAGGDALRIVAPKHVAYVEAPRTIDEVAEESGVGDLSTDAHTSSGRAALTRAGVGLGTLPPRFALEQEAAIQSSAVSSCGPERVKQRFSTQAMLDGPTACYREAVAR